MILVDTSIWIDHLHRTEAALVALLEEAEVCVHPMIIGELALGSLQDRSVVLALLADLPGVPIATHAEVLQLIESHAFYGTGLSLVDAHLLAALRLSGTTKLWTRDRRLQSAAKGLGVAAGRGADANAVDASCGSFESEHSR
jgi:predicted nucleic acid-binding protein